MSTDTPDVSDGRNARKGRKAFHTNLRVEPVGESSWKATEPDSEKQLFGRGSTPPEAVEHYCQLVQNGDTE